MGKLASFLALFLVLPGLQIRGGDGSGQHTAAADTPAAARVEQTISDFRLKDQFDESHTVTFPRRQPVVLLVADRGSHDALSRWITALRGSGATNATILGVADVNGVPGLFRGRVKSGFRKSYTRAVLLDWQGDLIKQLHPVPEAPNAYVLSPEGRVCVHFSGAPTPESLQEINRLAAEVGAPLSGNSQPSTAP